MELTEFYDTTDIDEFNKRHESISVNNRRNSVSSKISSSTRYCNSNNYNILRILMFLMTMLTFCVTLLYAIGQLLTLKLDDYFCSPKTLDEIHKHSIENNLNEGEPRSCWTTNHYESDQEKTFNAGYMTAYVAELDLSSANIFYCIMFLLISLYLLILFMYFIIAFINDCCSNKVFIETSPKYQTYKSYHCNYLHSWIVWYRTNFNVDQQYWIIQTMHQQLLKLTIESIVFLQYGGTQNSILYAFHSSSDNEIISAQKHQNLILFAVFLALNFIFTAILWFCYIYKYTFCHGRFFYGLLFIFAVIFEIFYIVFPLSLLGR
eukprot:398272_1